MVSWYQASERRRSRTDLARRQVRRALSSTGASASSSSASSSAVSSAPYSITGGGRRKFWGGGTDNTAKSSRALLGGTAGGTASAGSTMSPLKGRSLRLSYSSGGSGYGGASASASAVDTTANSRALVPAASDEKRTSPADRQAGDVRQPRRVAVDPLTAQAIQIEVLDLQLPASVYSVAQALVGCPQVTIMHGRSSYGEGSEGGGDGGGDYKDDGGGGYNCEGEDGGELGENQLYPYREEETPEERTARRVGELRTALQTLTSRVGSITQVVESWDEARLVLSEVLIFPDEHAGGGVAGREVEEGNGDEEEDMDELEREQRALEQGQGSAIVPIPSSAGSSGQKKRGIGRRSLVNKVYRSTKRSLTKVTARTRSGILSAARRNFMTKASYARMLLQRGELERMRTFKVLTSVVVPPPIVSAVEDVPPETRARIGLGDAEEVGAEEEEEASAEAEAARAKRAAAIAALSGLAKLDHAADRRLVEAEQIARARVDAETARQDAEMAAREAAEAEAEAQANRASTLLRDLTDEEAAIVRDAIYGIGRPDEILATSDTDSVQRQSLHKLQPGVWLNDEVIHYFLLMLARRDAELAARSPGRKRCHFFKSFFITKLLDEAGGYNYKNVKRWSRKVPGKDIFALDKIFFPVNVIHPDDLLARESDPTVNVSGMHWTVAVIHMTEKRIQFYDSMSGSGDRYLEGLMQYLKDEHMAKKGCPLPDADEWELVESTADTPQQRNGYDCGVFACMFCDFLSTDCPLTFSQEHITQCRERIALSIMKGVAIE